MALRPRSAAPAHPDRRPRRALAAVVGMLLLVPMLAATVFSSTASAGSGPVAGAPLRLLAPAAALAPATLTTQASPDVMTGGSVSDSATLSGAVSPTGAMRFTLYGPDDPTCGGTVAFVSVKPVTGNGTVSSAEYVTSSPGLYRWVVTYEGDANNVAITAPCNDPNEQVMVGVRSLLAGQASPTVAVGGAISDTATLTRAPGLTAPAAPTGTITFKLYAPSNTTCAGTPLATSTATVNALPASYTSASHTTGAVGTYRYVAVYSGDFYYTPAATACSDPNQQVEVTQAAPALSTQAFVTLDGSGTVSDVATLAGGFNPTGTITFRLYGPDDATCAGPAISTSIKTVSGNGGYESDVFVAGGAPGVYRYVAAYSGDDNNAADAGVCNEANESVEVVGSGPVSSISLTKTASPTSRLTPGGDFTFTAVVINTGDVQLQLQSLVDDVYGNLDGQGTCVTPTTLPVGDSYSCSFVGSFTGPPGAVQVDTITATANLGPQLAPGEVTATARATVRITGPGDPGPPSPTPSVVPTTPATPGGGLPVTGSETGKLLGLAAVLISLGSLAMLATRRRRETTTG